MTHHSFTLPGTDPIALCDLLKTVGIADSGGQAKTWIAAGEVLRNGVVETRKTAKIHAGEVITFGTTTITVKSNEPN